MLKKNLLFFCVFFFIISVLSKPALAGFGISPPYVTNDNLARGSIYEKKITIVRGNPDEDLKAEITINVEGANDWISINRGNEFILAKGEKQVPIIVTVKVPKDAPYGDYKGNIRIKTSPVGEIQKGAVTIALGAQIDVRLKVSKIKIFDFIIRGFRFFNTEEGFTKWIFHFPTKIVSELELENLGNIDCKPTKVVLNIYDENRTNLIETLEAKKLTTVKPFETGKIKAIFLSENLKAGNYFANYQIYKNQEIAQGGAGDLPLNIFLHNTIQGYQGASIFDLPLKEKIIILLPVLIATSLIIIFAWKFIQKLPKSK